jgi:hypothetical protein
VSRPATFGTQERPHRTLQLLERGSTVIRKLAGAAPAAPGLAGRPALARALPPATGRGAPDDDEQPPVLLELVHELLDAHQDTVRLAGERGCEAALCERLDYLRALQRAGHETLAHSGIGSNT